MEVKISEIKRLIGIQERYGNTTMDIEIKCDECGENLVYQNNDDTLYCKICECIA